MNGDHRHVICSAAGALPLRKIKKQACSANPLPFLPYLIRISGSTKDTCGVPHTCVAREGIYKGKGGTAVWATL